MVSSLGNVTVANADAETFKRMGGEKERRQIRPVILVSVCVCV